MAMTSISDLVPEDAESGVGLALQDEKGRLLFFLAGTKFQCQPGELFYAGIGGHRYPDEDWLACAHREAVEELGTDVVILSSDSTWRISPHSGIMRIGLTDKHRPIALYEMVHPPGTPRAGGTYYIVIFRASLVDMPTRLPIDEIRAVIALTHEQVIRGSECKPTLGQLLSDGAEIVAEAEHVDRSARLYPVGTAFALAAVLGSLSASGKAWPYKLPAAV